MNNMNKKSIISYCLFSLLSIHFSAAPLDNDALKKSLIAGAVGSAIAGAGAGIYWYATSENNTVIEEDDLIDEEIIQQQKDAFLKKLALTTAGVVGTGLATGIITIFPFFPILTMFPQLLIKTIRIMFLSRIILL
jgi:hypothetical protein